ncbi:glycosyltransferase [Tenacibaculum aquimarinum]|uniref:glycosyltransferase n=1 Tax=Tenacibaculum aquimarinum TaxID=2910675 RepID=UPI001F0B3CA7|nr:glycosyltransferase [Tenacibaculum aquimarinum]MCH3881380.1 glycosyltransferase [Tenacibaculum aquimarinum]
MNKKIIVAPLNWGLGHATRCVPIINSLLKNKYTPIIASDGNSLRFLQEEFPNLESIELPSYHIKYGKNLKLSLIFKAPKIWKAAQKEQALINTYVDKNKDIVGIISDNRFGVKSNKIPSVYITHQVNVLSGITTFLTSKIHQNIIKKFDECWVPDTKNQLLSGKLSSRSNLKNIKYIGVLSRFQKEKLQTSIPILIILSGPEPNKSLLEQKLQDEFLNYKEKVVLIQGRIDKVQKISEVNNITTYNFMLSNELQKAINSSEIIICRSGYSSIMDLAVLNKKVFFIPTKNQSEQEYLATYLKGKNLAPFCSKEDFTAKKISELGCYSGLHSKETELKSSLFSLFERKRKL